MSTPIQNIATCPEGVKMIRVNSTNADWRGPTPAQTPPERAPLSPSGAVTCTCRSNRIKHLGFRTLLGVQIKPDGIWPLPMQAGGTSFCHEVFPMNYYYK
eukprot:5747545-Pyramimonas_sp.AAC.1